MKIGLVGAGSMGHAHAPAWNLLRDGGADLVGVVADRPGSAAAFAQQYGLSEFESLDALIDAVDILDICTPTGFHRDMTLKAAARGKHVICEKPIALNPEDARIMIKACDDAGVRLFIAHVVRFHKHYRAAKDAIDAGQIGKPGVIRLTRAGYQPRKSTDNWFVDESRSGGMMLDLMIHDFDYARWIGGEVERVYARSVRGARPDAPGDYALVTLRFVDGAIAHIEGGWAYPPGNFRTSFDIAGTGGLIEWNGDNADTTSVFLANPPDVAPDEVAVPGMDAADSPFAAELRNFYEAIAHGAEPIVTAHDGLAALNIGLAARQSAKTGKPVTIQQEAS